jgi:uncharacterized protein with FMN-binding domain
MRRAVPAVLGTLAGLVGLLGYKSGAAPRRAAATAVPTASSAEPTTPTTPTTAATSSASRTVDGTDVSTRFGDVQVQVTVRGGRLTAVTPLLLPEDRPRSAQISERAAPILQQEALSAQSANIDAVSGATYTSEAYAQSLQAALDSLRSA